MLAECSLEGLFVLTKIYQLDHSFLGQQNVVPLHIPVHDVVAVQVVKCLYARRNNVIKWRYNLWAGPSNRTMMMRTH